jgi:carbamate kinase
VRLLLDNDRLVVCVGGGGVPVKTDAKGRRQTGMQAVVDKDLASAALAAELGADTLIMLTDGDFVSENWGTPEQRDLLTASADAIAELAFAEGSMQPKVDAAIRVARAGGRALIGPLDRLDDLLARKVGTEIRPEVEGGIVYV